MTAPTNMAREMYLGNRLHSQDSNVHTLQTMPGMSLRMANTGLPHVAEYDAFVALMTAGKNGNRANKMTGAKLRRAIVMKRNGCSANEVCDAIGISNSCLYNWLGIMPARLKGE